MTVYYLDTSALSKRYVQEIGTAWVRALVAPSAGHTLLTARLTMVEVYSALARVANAKALFQRLIAPSRPKPLLRTAPPNMSLWN
jgi:predicted nucleic acid-binding protein